MPTIAPTSFLPEIVQKVFQRYEKDFEAKRQAADSLTSKDTVPADNRLFFLELSALFGDVLVRALDLLDNQTISVYTTEERIREVVEITEGRTSQRVVKLLPNINFCLCENFTDHVLNLDTLQTLHPSPSQQRSIGPTASGGASTSYTCEHVLALRLARMLYPTPTALRIEILPKHKFNFLLKQLQ